MACTLFIHPGHNTLTVRPLPSHVDMDFSPRRPVDHCLHSWRLATRTLCYIVLHYIALHCTANALSPSSLLRNLNLRESNAPGRRCRGPPAIVLSLITLISTPAPSRQPP